MRPNSVRRAASKMKQINKMKQIKG
ncbi:hypothetical protein NB311A_15512 [Nitrobacter sp. Nb-311A]|nr:hypothetical protein NB311A_15512 [Nitrobacter sp. Nb-311A]